MASVINDLLRLHRRQLFGLVQLRGVRRLGPIYEEVRAELEASLAALRRRGMGQSFSAHHQRMVLLQVADGVRAFEGKLGKHLVETSRLTSALAPRHVVQTVQRLEKRFTGVSPALQVEQAAVLRGVYAKTTPSLMDRFKKSVRLYGRPTVEKVKVELSKSLLMAESVDQAVDRIVASGGVFEQQRWRAERIARTEMSYAYGVVKQQTMEEISRTDVVDLKKKLIETFDDRTGDDSKELHGQVVGVDEPFVWDSPRGRVEYMQPPNRPNDRAVVIPWRTGWPEYGATREGGKGPGGVSPSVPSLTPAPMP